MKIYVENICCEPSSEPSHRDGSDEGSQHMVLMRNKKNYHLLPLIWSSVILHNSKTCHKQVNKHQTLKKHMILCEAHSDLLSI